MSSSFKDLSFFDRLLYQASLKTGKKITRAALIRELKIPSNALLKFYEKNPPANKALTKQLANFFQIPVEEYIQGCSSSDRS